MRDSRKLRFEYAYEVGGRRYVGHRIRFGCEEIHSSFASTVNRYPVGSVVSVFADPEDLQTSALEPGVHAGTYFPAWTGGGVLVFAAISLYAYSTFQKKFGLLTPELDDSP